MAVRRVLLAGREMQSAMARRIGVRVTDLQAVDHVEAAESPIGTVELAARLGIRSASATVLVDRLVEAGHLTRSADPEDGRRVMLAITDHARVEVRQALAPLIARITTITAALDDDQAETVLGFLDDIVTAMREPTDHPG
nr:MarR family winged helix-turn-helix transcriptional regulator [Kibdelosporangium phytohabitans]